jgi:diguanylate cyclase (GGDEF)-like protein
VIVHARPRATDNVDADPFVNEASLPYIKGACMAAAPMRYRTQMLGALTCVGRHPFSAQDLELLGALGDQAAIAIENARLFQQVHVLSYTDPLTGLANRRQLERDIAREFAAARRGRMLVGVMFDLDRFKDYNDTYGHVAGDAALRAFGTVLARETRAMNLAARYGGDEFFVLLTDATEADAAVFVQRVLSRYREEVRKLGHDGIEAAAGFAAYQHEMRSPEALIEAADRALYESKRERSR